MRSLVVLHGHVLAPNSLAHTRAGKKRNGSRPIGWLGFGRQTLAPRRETGLGFGGNTSPWVRLIGGWPGSSLRDADPKVVWCVCVGIG